jgi:CheY-like chemotaxis protein
MPVIVVEDDGDIREDVADVLRDEGYEVLTAENGYEALTRLRESSKTCVILLDLMMPVMDGVEFRETQLRDPELAKVPVIVLSGAANARQKAADLKAVDILVKPFKLNALLEAVRKVCPC